jgi:signal transduction histidine kinase
MRSRTTRGSGVPGLGLGLYIAKGVVQAHGGRLWAESTPGETTTFHVALPIPEQQREAA